MPTGLGGSSTVRYSDFFTTATGISKRIRAAGGGANSGAAAGASCAYTLNTATNAAAYYSAPLCYFTEDPIIPLSQSIANNS